MGMTDDLELKDFRLGNFNAWMSVKGAKQGDFQVSGKGDPVIKGHEKEMRVYYMHNQILSPRDAASGLPSGKRVHKPIGVIKMVDSTSPKFFSAVTTNENLTAVKIEFIRANLKASAGTSSEEKFYSIELTNANVMSQERMLDESHNTLLEVIYFTYEKITETFIPSGVSATDSWLEPMA